MKKPMARRADRMIFKIRDVFESLLTIGDKRRALMLTWHDKKQAGGVPPNVSMVGIPMQRSFERYPHQYSGGMRQRV